MFLTWRLCRYERCVKTRERTLTPGVPAWYNFIVTPEPPGPTEGAHRGQQAEHPARRHRRLERGWLRPRRHPDPRHLPVRVWRRGPRRSPLPAGPRRPRQGQRRPRAARPASPATAGLARVGGQPPVERGPRSSRLRESPRGASISFRDPSATLIRVPPAAPRGTTSSPWFPWPLVCPRECAPRYRLLPPPSPCSVLTVTRSCAPVIRAGEEIAILFLPTPNLVCYTGPR